MKQKTVFSASKVLKTNEGHVLNNNIVLFLEQY